MLAKKVALSKDPGLLEILENSFFQREGFEMVLVEDDQTGCEAVESEAPALAIFSLATMGEQALVCCRRIKADPLLQQTSVLMLLAAEEEDEVAEACWAAGCDAVLHPPLDAARLLDAACGLLGINRRIAPRFPVCFQLQFTGKDQKVHHATAVNLNEDGMFLTAEQLFPVDTGLNLQFALPGSTTQIECSARVAWVNHPEWLKKNTLPCGMGVQFITLEERARQMLQRFLDSLVVA